MTVLMKREGNDVDIGGFKFKLDSSQSALGFFANNASKVRAGETVHPPFIIGKDGNKRPLYTKYEGIKINEILLYDVDKAEKAYTNKVCEQIKALANYKTAFEKVCKCKVAQTERRKNKDGWEYRQYTVSRYPEFYGKQLSIGYDFKEEKVKTKPKNLQVANEYTQAENKLSKINGAVRIYADILQRAIFHNLGKEYKASKFHAEDTRLEIFIINGKQYMFEWLSDNGYYRLQRYAFPSAYTKDIIKTMELKNNQKQWPFAEEK